MEVFEKMLVGKQLSDIFDDFGNFWQSLVSEDQIRWVSIACICNVIDGHILLLKLCNIEELGYCERHLMYIWKSKFFNKVFPAE